MSSFTIPYGTKQTDFSTKDAINLHLLSIAHMEAGLAKLMDGEAEEIRLVSDCNPCYDDILNINQSINRVLKNITKLQMLLHFKFDSIRHMSTGSHAPDMSDMTDGAGMFDVTDESVISDVTDESAISGVTDDSVMSGVTDGSVMSNISDTLDVSDTSKMPDESAASYGFYAMPEKTIPISKDVHPDASTSDNNKAGSSISQDAVSQKKKDISIDDLNIHTKCGFQNTEKMPYENQENSDCKAFRYMIQGRGVGTVSNPKDYFYNGIAIVQAFIHDEDTCPADGTCKEKAKIIESNDIWKANNFLYYSVHVNTCMQIITACSSGLKVGRHVHDGADIIMVEGKGEIIHKERFKPDIYEKGSFTLKIWPKQGTFSADSFQMVIKAGRHPEFSHDSGKVSLMGENQSLAVCAR